MNHGWQSEPTDGSKAGWTVVLSICLSLSVYLSFVYLYICLSIYPLIHLSISLPLPLSVYLPVYLSVFLSFSIHLSVYLSVSLSICLSICLSIYPSIYLPNFYLFFYLSICLSVYWSIRLSIYLIIYRFFHLFICLSFYLSIYLPICLFICLSIYLPICLFIYLSIYLFFCLFIYLSIYLLFCLSICLSIYLSVCLSIALSIYLSVYLSIALSICLAASLKTKILCKISSILELDTWQHQKCRNSARFPQCLNLATSKTQPFCGNSSIFEVDDIKNEAGLRDFLQKLKVEWRAGILVPMRSAIFPFHLSQVLRLPRKKCGPVIRSAAPVTWCSKLQPLSGYQRPDLLTYMTHVSLVFRLPREMHLCTSSSKAPRLPTLLKLSQNPHVLLTFGRVQNPLRLPHKRHFNVQKRREHVEFWAFWLRNVLRATTACSPHLPLWPAYFSALRGPPEPQIIGKT